MKAGMVKKENGYIYIFVNKSGVAPERFTSVTSKYYGYPVNPDRCKCKLTQAEKLVAAINAGNLTWEQAVEKFKFK